MGLIASILKHNGRSYANGGLSDQHNDVTIVNVAGPFEPTADRPAVMLVHGNVRGSVKAIPAEFVAGRWQFAQPRGSVGPMMGGSYIETSDSRFGEAVAALGGPRYSPVALHDRFETPEQYRALST